MACLRMEKGNKRRSIFCRINGLIAFREYQKCEKFEIKVPTQNLEV
jgi:hypothetical protein